MRFFTLPRIQSLATKFALASGAPFVVAAIILGLLVDFQLRSVSMSTEFSQVDEDVLFLVDEVRTLGDELKAQNQECVEPDVLVSAVEGSGGATFRFEPSACPAMGEPYKPALKATCFEQACVATLEVPHRRRVAFRAVALGSATCGIEGVPSIPGPDGCLFVWRDLTVHNQRVLGSRISAAIALVSAILISGLTAIVLANRVGRRISNINETFATFASGERTAQLTDPGQNDELADLASSVNTALRQIQQDIAASDRVNASLSHQLVAPIRQVRDTSRNALVKLTEVSRSGEPVEGQANTIRRVTEELEQVETELGHIVKIGEALQDFLSASRRRTARDLSETVDLEEVCEIVSTRFRSKAAQRGISIVVNAEPAEITFSTPVVDQMLGVLIDNAIIYGPARSTVLVQCGTSAEGAWLEVADEGAGPPEQVLMDVFSDTLLRRSTFSAREGRGGHGIGLLTVRQLAINCSVQFSQRSVPGGGWKAILFWKSADQGIVKGTGLEVTKPCV